MPTQRHRHDEPGEQAADDDALFASLRSSVQPMLRALRDARTATGPGVVRALSATLHATSLGAELQVEGRAALGDDDGDGQDRDLLAWTELVLVVLGSLAVDEQAGATLRDDAAWALAEAGFTADDLGFMSRGGLALDAEACVEGIARGLWPDLVVDDDADLTPDDSSVTSFPPPPW